MPFIIPILLAVSPIVIDGSFNDWQEGVSQQQDAHYLYQHLTLDEVNCLQQLPSPLRVSIGRYVIVFSPKANGYGVTCFADGRELSPYDIGLVFAPTTASTEFEIRINRPGTLQPKTTFDLSRPDGTDLRVVSWNVQFGNMLDAMTRSTRILRSLKPDMLLLQELDGDDTPKAVETFLHQALDGTWTVFMSDVWGTERHEQLRSAIATRLPCTHVKPDDHMPLKVVMADIDIGSHTFTFVSLHLRCCGGATSEAELQRQREARMIRHAIDDHESEGIVLSGDWNLVGTDVPLRTVESSDLNIVRALQPDGLLTATWSDVTSPFTPGRLDWMLHSKNAMTVLNAFVLDTSDLDEQTRDKYRLLEEDTAALSDHLPLVADLHIVLP